MHSPRESDPTVPAAPMPAPSGSGHSNRPRAPILRLLPRAPGDSALIEKLGWTAAAMICAAYVMLIVRLQPFPLQDYPNHLTRGAVLADLIFHHGARFGQRYEFHFMAVPYVLHDLILTACVELFGPVGGASLFSALVLLSLPCALLFYMHVNDLAPRARLLIFLISLYMATDWFFLMGFMAFRLAVALIVVDLALAEMLRRRWSVPLFIAYVTVLVLGYLTHLTAPVFVAVALGVSGLVRLWFRRTSARPEVYLLVPVATLLALHFGVVVEPHDAAHPAAFTFEWGTVHQKITSLQGDFYRFGGRAAIPMMLLLAACVLWPVRHHLHWHGLRKPEVLEQLALVAAFLVIYVLLPRAYADSTYVDVRALPMMAVFLIFAALHLPPDSPLPENPPSEGLPRASLVPESSSGRAFNTLPVLGLAAVLAVVNLGYLAVHAKKDNVWTARYRAVIASVPRGSHVLPVYTQPQTSILPFLHLDSFVVLDRDGVIPYLFSGDRGDPMTYFRYRHRPYMPDHWWYKALQQWNIERTSAQGMREPRHWYTDIFAVDWNRVACEYDFLLVTVPFDDGLIHVPTTRVVMNESVALLAVGKQGCQRDARWNGPPLRLGH